MDIHKNARLTPHSRAELVRRVLGEGQSKTKVAADFGVCVKTINKWVARFEADGEHGLLDRSSRPKRSPRQTQARALARIETLRRQRQTGRQIAQEVGVSPATVSRVLRRLGLHRLDSLEPAEPVCGYERENPGELVTSTSKNSGVTNKIGHRISRDRAASPQRRLGMAIVMSALTTLAPRFAEIMSDEKKETAIAFLGRLPIIADWE